MPKGILVLVTAFVFASAVWAAATTGTIHELAVTGILCVLCLVVLRHFALLVFALWERRLVLRPAPMCELVTVIVPAYNEARVITQALESLAALRWSQLEILVVDDGSDDDTRQRVLAFAASRPDVQLRVISQANAGKAAALNTGLAHARGDFVLCVDADSRVAPDVIARGLAHFDNPEVAAVGGFVAIGNRNNLLTRFQSLEYVVSLNFVRRAFSLFGAVPVVPGPIGLFRRRALLEIGGYLEGPHHFAEDAEVTVRLLSRGWRVEGDTHMVALTEAPSSLYALLRQRYRWKRGIYQALDANIFRLVTAQGLRKPSIGLVLLGEGLVLDLLNGAMGAFFLTRLAVHGEVNLMLLAYGVLVLLDLLTLVVAAGVGSLAREGPLLLLQRFTYSPLLQIWNLLALFDEWRSRPMDWDKLERRGMEANS